MNAPLQRTPLYDLHQALGARCVAFAGYELPVQYTSIVDEHKAVREAAGLFDVSHMGQLFVTGTEAAPLLDHLATSHITSLRPGEARYSVFCDEQGGILDDLILYRLAGDRYLIVCNAANRAKILEHIRTHARGVRIDDASAARALLALQGPRAVSVLSDIGADADLLRMPAFDVREADLAGIPTLVARTGYTGEDGFELSCDAEKATSLWQTLMQVGGSHGLKPVGLGARDTLRLEARLCLYGQDIDASTNPLEAGLGWVVKLDKPAFVGRTALLAIRQRGLTRKLVGFEMRGRGIARHGYPIVDENGSEVGQVTSGAPALSLGKNIGLGYVPIAQSSIGTTIGVSIRGKRIEAEIVRTPFYRRKR